MIKNHLVILIAIPLVILGSSFLFHPNHDFVYFRGLRTLISLLFLVCIAILHTRKNRLLKWHMFLYGASSFLTIWFEQEWMSVFAMLLNFGAWLVLILWIVPRLQFRKITGILLLTMIAVGIINGYLLYQFIQLLAASITSAYLMAAIILSTLTFFVLFVLIFIYNNESSTRASLTLVFAAIFLIFAEVLRGSGYYALIDEVNSQNLARVLLVTGVALLYHFGYLELKASSL